MEHHGPWGPLQILTQQLCLTLTDGDQLPLTSSLWADDIYLEILEGTS